MDYYRAMLRFNHLLLLVASIFAFGANAKPPVNAAAGAVSSALDGALFYQLLLGELQVREREPGVAYALLLDAARKTNDARLYQRAVDIALQAHSGDSALQAARAWRQALPASRQANRYVLQILIGLNRLGESQDAIKREIATADVKDRAAVIESIGQYFARASDKNLAAATLERALLDYLTRASTGAAAWSAVGRVRLDAGDSDAAMDAALKAQAFDSKSESVARLALSMMSAKVPQSEALVKNFLEAQPKTEIRMDYARVLLEGQRYGEALSQLQIITKEKPDDLSAWLIRGVIEVQDGKLEVAESSLKRYVALAQASAGDAAHGTTRGLTQAYLSLAQIAEKKKNFSEADAWLARIDNTEDVLNAQLRRAAILAREGKLTQAIELVRSQPEKSATDARLKLNAEVQLLRDSKQFDQAYVVLTSQLAANPDDFELIYDLAMVAEKLGNLEEMERLLRRVMAGQPDRAHAYNALGYSLAERRIRLTEARELIMKAMKYAPGDSFIADSLGWVEFRSGNLVAAQRILEEAFKARPDAEIAAHLGEVLWAMGQRDQAVSIWKEGARINAENETLLETLKRLRIKL